MSVTDQQARENLRQALLANNELYRTGKITREQWTATNRDLAAQGERFGMMLPPNATQDR